VGRATLSDVCDRLDIDRTSRAKHRAKLDADLCAEVFKQLVFGRKTPQDNPTDSNAPPSDEAASEPPLTPLE
jgi:DNA polymerase III epsilon subunit-like protein